MNKADTNDNFTNKFLKEVISNDKPISLRYDSKNEEAYFKPLWNDVEPPERNTLKFISKCCGYANEKHFINDETAELRAIAKNSYSDFKSYKNQFSKVKESFKKLFWIELVDTYEAILNRKIFMDENLKKLTQTLILNPFPLLIRYQIKNTLIKKNDTDKGFDVQTKNKSEVLELTYLIANLFSIKYAIDLASLRKDLAFHISYNNFYGINPLKSFFNSTNQNKNSKAKRGRRKRIRANEHDEFRLIAKSLIGDESIVTREDFFANLADKWTEKVREIEESTIRKNYSDLLSDLLDKLD